MVYRSSSKNMVLIKNKKGMFFTMFVIVVLSLFVLSYTLFSSIKERRTTQDRVTTLNNLVFSLEENLKRQLQISTFRIIFLFEKRIIEKGNYITNIQSAFNETFYKGTVEGTSNPEINAIMQGAKSSDIIKDLQENARKLNANLTILEPKIYLSQDSPWEIKLTLESNLIIKDLNNLAVWNITHNISAYTSIENFEDPIYIVSTNALATNKIIRTPYIFSSTDPTNLSSHIQKSYYINSSEAPSFLDRLQGSISTNNKDGIESIVNLPILSSKGVPVTMGKSVVDHIYFSSSNPSSSTCIGTPAWFKLDSSHPDIYQASCT